MLVWLLIAPPGGDRGNFQLWLNTAPQIQDRRTFGKIVTNARSGNTSGSGGRQLFRCARGPGFRPVVVYRNEPTSDAIIIGQSTASELRRQIGQLSTAQMAIVPKVPNS